MTCPCHDPGVFGHHQQACPATSVPSAGYLGASGRDSCPHLMAWALHCPIRVVTIPAEDTWDGMPQHAELTA
jgi:hypothetical protein